MQSEDEPSTHAGLEADSKAHLAELISDDQPVQPIVNLLLDTVFAEKYRILSLLGEGGMSLVYLARHEGMNKLVAIKTLQTHLTGKTTSLLRFRQEAQAASRLQHPGIVAIHDYGITEDGMPYLVMDYIEGESLSEILRKETTLKESEAIDLFLQTTSAIAHAHQRGVVHRDLKPSNIMLHRDKDDRLHVKIVDFGVAKFVESKDSSKLTQTGESIGSPLYMSPEQCTGRQLDVRSDVYSFGCVMYEVLVGIPAMSADSVFGTMIKQTNEMPPAFKSARPDIKTQDGLERIVFKALAKEPEKRYQTMSELESDLNGVGQHRGLVRRVLEKCELTSLRKTTKSLNFLAASSLVFAVAIIVGAQFALTTFSNMTASPVINDEPVIWERFPDEHAIQSDPVKDKLLGSAQEMFLRGQNSPDLFCTHAVNLRNKHLYDAAKVEFAKAINGFLVQKGKSTGLVVNDLDNKLLLALIGLGDCEYFADKPQFKDALSAYGDVAEMIKLHKKTANWLYINSAEQWEVIMRWIDCKYMQGNFQEFETLRLSMLTYLSGDQLKLKPTYRALFESKLGESDLRLGKFGSAKQAYLAASADWKSRGQGFEYEQLIVAGRLAQLEDKLNDTADAAYSHFANLADKVQIKGADIVVADMFQSYAHYLWHHKEIMKANEMHQRSERYKRLQVSL